MEVDDQIKMILKSAKKLAQRYRRLTRKPLGVAGEIAKYEVAQHLNLELVTSRQARVRRDPTEWDKKLSAFGSKGDAFSQAARRVSGSERST